MRTESFHSDRLLRLLRERKIASIAEMKAALGTDVDVTVFRKLKDLEYRTSYSHRGSYYTLDEIARFDDAGLWSHRDIWFSCYGTLLNTGDAFVTRSDAGYYAEELDHELHVETRAALLKLVRAGRLARQEIMGRYLYHSSDPVVAERQVTLRRLWESRPVIGQNLIGAEGVPDELKAAMVLFASLLDEKRRRLYAGLESLQLGYGGDGAVADFLGMDPHTVAKGRRQLLAQDFEVERLRRAGGGRKAVEKKRPK
jgi:hypothetical protein